MLRGQDTSYDDDPNEASERKIKAFELATGKKWKESYEVMYKKVAEETQTPKNTQTETV